MRCLEAHEWMSLKLDGRLSVAEQSQLDAHLNCCPACAEQWRQWQEIDALLAGTPMVPAPSRLAVQVLARIQRRPRWGALWGSVVLLSLGLVLLCMLYAVPALGQFYSVVTTAAETPGIVAVLISGAMHILAVVGTIAEMGRLLLRAILTSRSVLIAALYVFIVLATLAVWLRVVVFRTTSLAEH